MGQRYDLPYERGRNSSVFVQFFNPLGYESISLFFSSDESWGWMKRLTCQTFPFLRLFCAWNTLELGFRCFRSPATCGAMGLVKSSWRLSAHESQRCQGPLKLCAWTTSAHQVGRRLCSWSRKPIVKTSISDLRTAIDGASKYSHKWGYHWDMIYIYSNIVAYSPTSPTRWEVAQFTQEKRRHGLLDGQLLRTISTTWRGVGPHSELRPRDDFGGPPSFLDMQKQQEHRWMLVSGWVSSMETYQSRGFLES